MKKSMRKMLCIIASLAVILAFMPAIAFADDIYREGQEVMSDGKSVKVTLSEPGFEIKKIEERDVWDYVLKEGDYKVSGKNIIFPKEFIDGETGYKPFSHRQSFIIYLESGEIIYTKYMEFYCISNFGVTIDEMVYNGKQRYAKLNGIYPLKPNKDYKKIYKQKKRKAIGKYTVTIKGIGDYNGSFKKTFKIIPKKPKIVSAKKTKTTATIKWKKVKNCSGYVIELLNWVSDEESEQGGGYNTYKKVTIKSKKRTSKKFTNIKKSKCDACWMRSYKVVNGKRIYSHWSKRSF